jgi:hypothetical protein
LFHRNPPSGQERCVESQEGVILLIEQDGWSLLTLAPLSGPNDAIVLQRHGFSEEIAMSGPVSLQKCKFNYTAVC